LLALLLPVLLLAQGAALKPAELVKKGVEAENAGNWQEAAEYYGRALAGNPKLGEAHFRLGKLLVEHERDTLTAGIALLEAAKTYKYDLFQVSRWLGLGYYLAGNYSSAIENYLKAVEKKPKAADVRVELANVYYANGSDDEAMVQDSIALALDVRNIEAQLTHGRLHARRREYDLARDAYRGVILQNPSRAEAYSLMAELLKSSQPDSAIHYYRKYLELVPDDATANFNLSGLYYNMSQKDYATLKLPPNPAESLEIIIKVAGNEYTLMKLPPVKPTDSLTVKAYQLRRDSVNASYRATYSESAFVYVGKAIKLGFSREDIYDFYVKIAQAANKRGASITALRTVLENNPKNALNWALLGQVYADSAVVKGVVIDTAAMRQSISCYKQATAIDSTMRRRTYAWIASQYYKQKQYDSAVAYYTKVITIDPKSASAYINRGYAYFQLQQKSLGVADLEKSAALDPKGIPARIYLMVTYWQDKQYDQAYDLAKAVLELDPTNEQAKAIRKNVEAIRNPKKPEDE
jgi:tetratricopeptide (TPR) repeat protein